MNGAAAADSNGPTGWSLCSVRRVTTTVNTTLTCVVLVVVASSVADVDLVWLADFGLLVLAIAAGVGMIALVIGAFLTVAARFGGGRTLQGKDPHRCGRTSCVQRRSASCRQRALVVQTSAGGADDQ